VAASSSTKLLFVQPASARNEVVAFVRQGLQDLSISRSTFNWGIPIPWDDKHVLYVWIDALLNYATAVGYGDESAADKFARTWPPDVHLVGKDILRFHAVIWPAMLMAAEVPLPTTVFAHGWLLVGGEKMSKSKLTAIPPGEVTDVFGSDAFRYYFLRAIPFGQDGSFSWEDMAARYKAELADQLGNLDAQTKAFLAACADTAAGQWKERDQGIWEVRGEPRHFLYSKVMCWVALDRAIALADQLDAAHRVGEWTASRDEIFEFVVREGWNDEVGAFTQYVGGTELDASNLMMPIVGFLPADDPRILATIDATEKHLTDDRGLVYRYRTEGGVDGLAGEEGTFLLCTFWLAQALALSGQVERATAVFERAAAFVTDVGLLAEEVDAGTGELLGNMPQAFSHIGLVNAAWAIAAARS